jgi:DNA polymerase IV
MQPVSNRAVVHMDLDSFFVSVERKHNHRLAGVPLIIGGGSDRSVVASCSYEARRFGVSSAMPMKLARRLCPAAIVIAGDMERYTRESQEVTEVIRTQAPLFEKASIDEFYVDLSGLERFLGTWKWARELRQRVIRETALPISFALAANKMVAKVATGEAKPNGQKCISRGTEAAFLGPLPVERIPMAGPKTATLLSNMGVRRIATLREMPRQLLERVLGKMGGMLWQRAHGIDDTPIVPWSERKSISTETTFEQDTIDLYAMRATLVDMTGRVGFQMRKEHKLAATITVKIRYSDFNTITKQARIPYTGNDRQLSAKVLELFESAYNRRLLVRLLGVRLSHFIHGGHQISLLDDTESQIKLYSYIDKIKIKYGSDSIRPASAMGSIY